MRHAYVRDSYQSFYGVDGVELLDDEIRYNGHIYETDRLMDMLNDIYADDNEGEVSPVPFEEWIADNHNAVYDALAVLTPSESYVEEL